MKRMFTSFYFLRVSLILLSFFVFVPNANAVNYWQVSSSSDANTYGTLRYAVSHAVSGDVISFSASVTSITIGSSISWSIPLTIDATIAPTHRVNISGAIPNGFTITSTNDVTIKGLNFSGFTSSCIAMNNVTNYTISNCWFGLSSTGNAVASTSGSSIFLGGTIYGTISSNVFNTSASNGTCISLSSAGSGGLLNQIVGNYFGTNYDGTSVLGLGSNAAIKSSNTSYVKIDGNIMEGSTSSSNGAIFLTGSSNTDFTIQNNQIGLLQANSNYNGILFSTYGENFIIRNNTINNSQGYAIDMGAAIAHYNVSITKNSFTGNASGGINNKYTAPSISSATTSKIIGTAAGASASVDLYKWVGSGVAQGTTWVAAVTADASGNWSYTGSFAVGDVIVVTSTPVSGDLVTSRFSAYRTVVACPTTVNAGSNNTVCSNVSTENLVGTVANQTGVSWSQSGGAGSIGNANSVNTAYYTLTGTDVSSSSPVTITFTLTATSATCTDVVSTRTLVINPQSAAAASNQNTCANAAIGVTLDGSVTHATGGSYTGGGGSYSLGSTTLNTAYSPSGAEKTAGVAHLILTTTGGACPGTTKNFDVIIAAAPTITPSFTTPSSGVICETGTQTVTATKTGASGLLWSTSGDGKYSGSNTSTATSPVYTPGAADKTNGSVTLTVTTTGLSSSSCVAVSNSLTLSIKKIPTVTVGTDQIVCSDANSISLSSSVTNATGVTWSGSSPVNFSSSTAFNPVYTPTTNDKTNGSVILTAYTTGHFPGCAPANASTTITFKSLPTVSAGADQTICLGTATAVNLSGTVTNASGGSWTTTGSGNFNDANSLTPTYTLSTAELAATTQQTITFTLTSTGGDSHCSAGAPQSMTVTVKPKPIVIAGGDQIVCSDVSNVSLTSSVTNATGVNWSGSPAVNFSSATAFNPVYTPTAADRTNGSVTLTATTSGHDASCTAATATTIITFKPLPTVSAGADQTICLGAATAVNLSGTASNASGGSWTTTGSGNFNDANSLTPTYTLSTAELAATAQQTITFTLISTGGDSHCSAGAPQSMNLTVKPKPIVTTGGNQIVCEDVSSISFTSSVTNATGVSWSGGTNFNPTVFNPTYIPTAAERSNGSVSFTVMTTGQDASCIASSENVIVTFKALPVVTTGANQTICAGTVSVPLSGMLTNATGGQWTKVSATGSFSLDTDLNTTYTLSDAERNTTTQQLITVRLTATGSDSHCSTLIYKEVTVTITPKPTVDPGIDQSTCASNSTIVLQGTVTNATGGIWTTNGTGRFSPDDHSLTTLYTASSADKTAGRVTFTLTSSGNGVCTAVASHELILTFNDCLIDPNLLFESPSVYKTNGSAPFKHNFLPLNSSGAITYAITTPTNCVTISPDGFVTSTCVDTVIIEAYQALKPPYNADTASYVLYIGKAVSTIALESRGSFLNAAPFRLQVQTNYDQPLIYAIVGGDAGAVTLSSNGLITPNALGTVIIRAYAPGDANFNQGYSNDAKVTIYPVLTKPVAVNDTLHLLMAEVKTIHIANNDYGTTASINLNPMRIDIDLENEGIQNKYFKPGVGTFTVDSAGVLTYASFEAFIGVDSLQYTITDSNNYTSDKANVMIYVTSPIAEIALKANEIITANGDQLNGALVIGYTDLTQSNDLLIVDAAGNKLFYTKDYQNNWSATDSSGRELGNGVYYFIFREFDLSGAVRRQLKGNFTVIR